MVLLIEVLKIDGAEILPQPQGPWLGNSNVGKPHYRRKTVPSGSNKTCFVPAGAVSVNSVLGSSAKTNARKRCFPSAFTAYRGTAVTRPCAPLLCCTRPLTL